MSDLSLLRSLSIHHKYLLNAVPHDGEGDSNSSGDSGGWGDGWADAFNAAFDASSYSPADVSSYFDASNYSPSFNDGGVAYTGGDPFGGTQDTGGWQSQVSGDQFSSGGAFMSGQPGGQDFNSGDYSSWGGFPQADIGGWPGGGGFAGGGGAYIGGGGFNGGQMNFGPEGVAVNWGPPSNPNMAEDLMTLSGRDPYAGVYQGSQSHFQDSFGPFGDFMGPGGQVSGPYNDVLGGMNSYPSRPSGSDPNDGQQAISDMFGGPGYQQQGGAAVNLATGQPVMGGQAPVGQNEGAFPGQNNYTVEGKDQSQFAPAQVGLLTNDPNNFFSSPSFGWGPMSPLAASQGAFLTDVGPGYFGAGRDSFDSRFGGPYAPSAEYTSAMTVNDKGDRDANTFDSRYGEWGNNQPQDVTDNNYPTYDFNDAGRNVTDNNYPVYDFSQPTSQGQNYGDLYEAGPPPAQIGGPPLSSADVYAMSQNLYTNAPSLTGGNIGYDLGQGFGGRGEQLVADNSRGPFNPDDNNQNIFQESNYPTLSEFMGPGRGENQNMSRANSYPTLSEFMGPGRGQSQNMYAPSRDSDRGPLQVTVSRAPNEQSAPSRGISQSQASVGRGGLQGQMDALLATARTAPTQAGRIAALDALNGLISANYGRGPNQSVGRGPYGGDPDPFISGMLSRGR